MKIGYNQATAMGCSTLEKDLLICEKVGFDYIEIRLDMLSDYLKTHTVGNLRSFFASSRIKPHAFNALYTYREMFSPDDDSRRKEEVIRQFMLGCEVGREIGAHYFVIVTPMIPAPSTDVYPHGEEDMHEHCVRILTQLVEIAGNYGIRLCFEPVGFQRCAVRNIRQAHAITCAVNHPDVGLALDTYNLFVDGGNNDYSAIKQLSPEEIFVAHIQNADILPAEKWGQDTRRFCDKGMLDLADYLQNLKEVSYDGVVSIEVFRPEYWAMQPEWVIEQAYKTTRECLALNECL